MTDFVDSIRYTQEAKQRIAELLSLQGDEAPSVLADIEVWGNLYRSNSNALLQSTPAKERAKIKKVETLSHELSAALTEADSTYLLECGDISDLLTRLARLAENASASQKLKVPRGRQGSSFGWFVLRLKKLYESRTTARATITYNDIEGRYEGKFFILVEECFTPFSFGRSVKNTSLGKSIQRVLDDPDKYNN